MNIFKRHGKDSRKDSLFDGLGDASTDDAREINDIDSEMKHSRLNFFDLPAELRNAIYEHVVTGATLSLTSTIDEESLRSKLSWKKRKSVSTPINGLLLASQQCRREYLSVLLTSMDVVVEVIDFDFENLMRVSATLGEFEKHALRSNRHLRLQLITQNCTPKMMLGVRRWLDHRSKNLESNLPWKYKKHDADLPWKYEFPLQKLLPPTTMGRVRLYKEVEYYAYTLGKLRNEVPETQHSELKAIVEAFQESASWLEKDLGLVGQRTRLLTRNLRGLAGGGYH